MSAACFDLECVATRAPPPSPKKRRFFFLYITRGYLGGSNGLLTSFLEGGFGAK